MSGDASLVVFATRRAELEEAKQGSRLAHVMAPSSWRSEFGLCRLGHCMVSASRLMTGFELAAYLQLYSPEKAQKSVGL